MCRPPPTARPMPAATRAAAQMELRNGRKINRRVHAALPAAINRFAPWAPPPYAEWPSQDDGPAFVRFVRENFDRFKRIPSAAWRDQCVGGRTANGKLSLLPHQRFIQSVVSPATTLKRMLIAASTGSGKTMLVANIVCNFLDPKLYAGPAGSGPGGRAKPSAILILTQNAALKEQLYATLLEDAPCVARQFAKHPDPDVSRLNKDLHPNAWGEKWLQSHDIPVHVLTYGQAVRRPLSLFNGAVVVMDEAHTLMDTSALVAAQQKAVQTLKHVLSRADIDVLIGLTGSPLGQSWKHFVGMHNVFSAPHDRLTLDEFRLLFLDSLTLPNERNILQRCSGKETEPTVEIWNPKSVTAVHDLALKIGAYMYFYDASFDESRYATPVNVTTQVEPNAAYVTNALTTGSRKLRDTFGRTRLVATDNVHKGTAAMLERALTREALQDASPVVAALLERLEARTRKAVIYTNVSAAYGADFVEGALRRFLPDAPLYVLSSKDTAGGQRKAVIAFNKHQGMKAESAVLLMGAQFSTGIDVSGAAGEMHLLNVMPNDALETQVRGRVHRSCSHRGLPAEEWRITYYQYKTVFLDAKTGMRSCDQVIENYRDYTDSVMVSLRRILRAASLGCPAMARHHRHAAEDCATGAPSGR